MRPRFEKIEWCLEPYTEAGVAAWNRVQALVDAALTERRLAARSISVQEARRRAVGVLAANIMANGKRKIVAPIGDIERKQQYVNLARDTFDNVVRALQTIGLVDYKRYPGSQTKGNEIMPKDALLTLLGGCTRKDTRLAPDAELVIVKDKLSEAGAPLQRSTFKRYIHTEETLAMRDRVRTINNFLTGEDPTTRTVSPRVTHPSAGGATYLRRYFSRGSFEFGGRMFGHWAQNVPKVQRHLMEIDGTPTVQVDYRTMIVRLLYAREGLHAPVGDVYSFDGWKRDGVKLVVATLLSRDKASNSFPKRTHELGAFPNGTKFAEVEQAIYGRLPLLREHANQGVGLRLMRTESDCLDYACAQLVAKGIGFVPLFDAVLVPVHEAGRAQYFLWKAFKEVSGLELQPEAWPAVTPCGQAAAAQLAGVRTMGQ